MNVKRFLLCAVLVAVFGCASAPIATDLSAIAENPGAYKNKRIEITGFVLENQPPRGDEYRTWAFSIGSSQTYRIMASEEGFNPSTIEKAYHLVEEARRTGEAVTVTGRLRVGPYQELRSGMEIELDSVRYRDIEIRTDKGPFVRTRYPYYPYSLHYYYGPPYWHYGFYYHHYW